MSIFNYSNIRSLLKKLRLYSAIFFLLLPSIALADIPADKLALAESQETNSDDWTFRLAPYGWATAVNGTTGIKGINSKVNVSMSDVLEHVDGAAMIAFEARKDRWSINTDFIYANLTDSAPTPRGLIFKDASLELDEIVWTEALGYTVFNGSEGSLDVLVGLRLMSLDVNLSLDGAVLPNGQEVQSRGFSDNKTWVDPVIGFRGRLNLTEDMFLHNVADIGGFGVSSSLTWQAITALGYRLCNSSSIAVGYRGMGYDYTSGGFKYNIDMYGPFIGAEVRF